MPEPADLRLRPATPADADFVVDLHRAAFRDLVQTRYSWDDHEQGLAERERFDPVAWQIIEFGGRPGGQLCTRRATDGSLFVERISLLPQAQNQGFGTQILRQLMHGEASITLSVWDTNRAVGLYLRLGFVETHREGFRIKMRWTAP